MGHVRLGELPKTKKWSRVVQLLNDRDATAPVVAAAVVAAAEKAYRAAGDDPGLVESLRIMAEVADASRQPDFADRLRQMGIVVHGDEDAVGLLSAIFQVAEKRFGPPASHTIFTEFASAALQEALTQTVANQTGSLFASGLDDAREAYRSISTERGFGRLSRLFFARLLSRSLRYFLDHATANQLGGHGAIRSEVDLRTFHAAVDVYGMESAKIVEDFAGQWYSKRRWLGEVSQTEGLAHIAMRKVADEIARAS